MEVTINGKKQKLAGEMNLAGLLRHLSLPTERIAIELNKDVIRKKEWEKTGIKDLDRIEIIHFVGGG